MAEESVRARVIVRGRVQGVFFRDGARRAAAARGLAGWVRNRADETVEAVFQGRRTDVEALITWCGQGPPRAQVSEVSVEWQAPLREEAGFRILG